MPESGAESGALDAQNAHAAAAKRPLADPDLARVVEAWSKLPEALRAGIVAMVNASKMAGEAH